jgi:NhaA family Na+:H+ antiporter
MATVPTYPRPERLPLAERLVDPFRRFVQVKSASGVVLIAAAVAAMVWANVDGASYAATWRMPIGFTIGAWNFGMPLQLWINDVLMSVFFLLVGLEIKRELLVGELSTVRTAMLPLLAALGGMVVPALIYTAINRGGPGAAGWGVPTATDIAFALGVLALVAKRAPQGLTVFLAALAIADDLGAVLLIGLVYGHAPTAASLAYVTLAVLGLVVANVAGVRRPIVYLALGLVLWIAVHASGIHATVAGVLLAFTVPARALIDPDAFADHADETLVAFRANSGTGATMLSNEVQQHAIASLEDAAEAALPPLARMLHALHVPVNFVIMPVFALANAGIALDGMGSAAIGPVSLGIVAGLVLGKPIGILLATRIALAFGARLPGGVGWGQLTGAACLAGIGFTMSIFVASLAFPSAARLDEAKLGIFAASLVAGVLGALVVSVAGRRAALPARAPDAAVSTAG